MLVDKRKAARKLVSAALLSIASGLGMVSYLFAVLHWNDSGTPEKAAFWISVVVFGFSLLYARDGAADLAS